ncbi:lipase [Schumannella luteola]|nr:lipase [Schumannella luteola]
MSVNVDERGVAIRRLPDWTRAQYGNAGWVDRVSAHTSGVRLEWETAASWIELEAVFTRFTVDLAVASPDPVVVAAVDGHPDVVITVPFTGPVLPDDATSSLALGDQVPIEPIAESRECVVRIPLPESPVPRKVVVWLPHRHATTLRYATADAALHETANSTAPRWVHYGSSISHGGEADTPADVWPVVAARRLGLDLVNFGLAGQAHLDPFVARSIADTPADLISLKIGINVVNGATFRKRSFVPAVHGFLDLVREGHPTTPIVVVSPIHCPAHEDSPGPTVFGADGVARSAGFPVTPGDGQLTLVAIRRLLEELVAARTAQGDPNLSYLDGLTLLGTDDVDLLLDGLHPGSAGLRQIGERFAAHDLPLRRS